MPKQKIDPPPDAFAVPQWATRLFGEADQRAPIEPAPASVEPEPVERPDIFIPAATKTVVEAQPDPSPKRGGWPKGKPRK